MTRFTPSGVGAGVLVFALLASARPANAGIVVYTDRSAFLLALGGPTVVDDYETYATGDLVNGAPLGDFTYTFDPGLVQPVVVSDGLGGQALGGPFDVFVGGDSVTLTYPGPGSLRAFGLDWAYAPSFEPVPGDLYRLRVDDGAAAGSFAGNSAGLDELGGAFFLGVIADPGSEFSVFSLLSSVPLDAFGDPYLVPAYQLDNLTYAPTRTPVPEPALTALLLVGSAAMAAKRRLSA